jgi:hypothetical protein
MGARIGVGCEQSSGAPASKRLSSGGITRLGRRRAARWEPRRAAPRQRASALRTVRASVEALADDRLSGRWRRLQRRRLRRRPMGAHRDRPDPEEARTVARLEHGVRAAVRRPAEGVLVVLD